MTKPAPPHGPITRRVAGQGALLLTGFAVSQILSFGRNALLGHTLARGDFGVAAILTLLLQLLDSLTDLGVDRLIVQARDGGEPRFVATQQFALVVRGLFIGTVLFLASGPIAGFFAVPEAAAAFAAIAAVPVIKGFQNLDARRAQRSLDNGPFLWIEVLPQAVALALTWPVVTWVPDFNAVVWLALAQAAATFVVSHAVAARRYALVFDTQILRRLVDFGWPIWLSAFPLIAVYHGDRIVIGRVLGMDALAGYSAAFMVAMVPGLIAAKVGQSLMLPMFAAARDDRALLARRFAALMEATVFIAAAYLATAMLLGGTLLEIAFGASYAGLGGVMAWLAAMWAVRMLQAVPGMVLLAAGETRPFLTAGLVRAAALLPAAGAAVSGCGLETVAAAGVAGELASLLYVTWRMEAQAAGLAGILARRALFLVPAVLASGLALLASATPADPLARTLALAAALAAIVLAACVMLPEARSRVRMLARA